MVSDSFTYAIRCLTEDVLLEYRIQILESFVLTHWILSFYPLLKQENHVEYGPLFVSLQGVLVNLKLFIFGRGTGLNAFQPLDIQTHLSHLLLLVQGGSFIGYHHV